MIYYATPLVWLKLRHVKEECGAFSLTGRGRGRWGEGSTNCYNKYGHCLAVSTQRERAYPLSQQMPGTGIKFSPSVTPALHIPLCSKMISLTPFSLKSSSFLFACFPSILLYFACLASGRHVSLGHRSCLLPTGPWAPSGTDYTWSHFHPGFGCVVFL